MNTFLWILQGAIAAFFIMPAFIKLTSTKAQLVQKHMLEGNGSVIPVRLIGTADLLGAIGIVIPYLLGIYAILTPIAAIGICIIMSGAFIVHYQRKEFKILTVIVLAFICSAIVAYFRFQMV